MVELRPGINGTVIDTPVEAVDALRLERGNQSVFLELSNGHRVMFNGIGLGEPTTANFRFSDDPGGDLLG